MGIESDQLVFDYLSRVGDLAQQRQLPSATRMRLVTELRGEIDRHRAKVTVDSPAAVRRILDRLGSPDRIVSGAQEGGGVGGGGGAADPAQPLVRPVPEQRTGRSGRSGRFGESGRFGGSGEPGRFGGSGGSGGSGGGGLRKKVPRPRRDAEPAPVADDRDVPAPPHLAGTDELGTAGVDADWWQAGFGDGGAGSLSEPDSVPGFVGGVEIPDILKPPSKNRRPDLRKKPVVEPDPEDDDDEDEDEGEGGGEEEAEAAGGRTRKRRMPRLGTVAAGGLSSPLLLLAAAALVVGAFLGNVLVLLIGWAVVYLSRQLTLNQKKWAVFGLPGLAAAGGIVWLWGRTAKKWGAHIDDGQMSGAINETWPWVLRCAAVLSALYLVWRSQRPRGR